MYDRQNITRQAQHQGYPVTMEKNPDGTWTEAAVYIGWAGFVEGTSWQKDNKLDVRNTTTLTYTPIKQQLIFKGDFTYYSRNCIRTSAFSPATTASAVMPPPSSTFFPATLIRRFGTLSSWPPLTCASGAWSSLTGKSILPAGRTGPYDCQNELPSG